MIRVIIKKDRRTKEYVTEITEVKTDYLGEDFGLRDVLERRVRLLNEDFDLLFRMQGLMERLDTISDITNPQVKIYKQAIEDAVNFGIPLEAEQMDYIERQLNRNTFETDIPERRHLTWGGNDVIDADVEPEVGEPSSVPQDFEDSDGEDSQSSSSAFDDFY